MRGTALPQPPGTRCAWPRRPSAGCCCLGAPLAPRGRRPAARGCSLEQRRGRRRSAKAGGCSSSAAEEVARWVSPRCGSPRSGRPAGMGRSPVCSWPRRGSPPRSSPGRLLRPRGPLTDRASNGGAGGSRCPVPPPPLATSWPQGSSKGLVSLRCCSASLSWD